MQTFLLCVFRRATGASCGPRRGVEDSSSTSGNPNRSTSSCERGCPWIASSLCAAHQSDPSSPSLPTLPLPLAFLTNPSLPLLSSPDSLAILRYAFLRRPARAFLSACPSHAAILSSLPPPPFLPACSPFHLPLASKPSLPPPARLSLSSTDVAVPDWCFHSWPEASIPPGGYDEHCAALAACSLEAPTEERVCWMGTAHHHPSRMKLVALAKQSPHILCCVDVVDKTVPCNPLFRSLAEQVSPRPPIPPTHAHAFSKEVVPHDYQVRRFRYLLDIEGKGYSSRLKLLLHSGRAVFVVARPWREFYDDKLTPWVHYIPVRHDLSDLVEKVLWARAQPEEVSRIAACGQAFAQQHLTTAAAKRALRAALASVCSRRSTLNDPSFTSDDDTRLMRGQWASHRGEYDATRMYYRWTFMPVSKDRRRPLALLASRGQLDWEGWDMYTFGVYTGASIKFWFEQARGSPTAFTRSLR